MSPQIELSSFLDAIRRRWRQLRVLRAAGTAAAGVAIILGAFAVVFWLARPGGDIVLGLALAAALASAAWIVRTARPSLHVPDDQRLARFIEERRPEFGDELAAAVDARSRDSAFANAIVAEAAMHARSVPPGAIVQRQELRQAAGRGLLACTLLLAAGGASFEPAHRAWDAAGLRLFPSRVTVSIEPGDRRLIVGQPFTARARVEGVPDTFDGQPVVTLRAAEDTVRETMIENEGVFEWTLSAVETSFTYEVEVAGARSSTYRVTVLRRPDLRGIDVTYDYPPYTGLPGRTETDSGDIYAPAGTRVTLRVRADKPIQAGAVRFGERAVALEAAQDPTSRSASFVVQRDGSYRVDLIDTDGLASPPSPEYFVRVTDDRPPEVRIVRPEGDRTVTPLEEIQIEARAEDDFRLSGLDLVYAVGAGPEQIVRLGAGGGASLSGRHLLYIEDLQVQPGDVIRLYARAREAARRGAREARSEMLLLDVSPFDQEFSLAQSQAGNGMSADGNLDAMIQAQKNLVNATWNLLRRESAGRSASDIDALATAQGELKARAEGLAGRARREGRDPMQEAAAAMARAETALRGGRLQDAVPHEMAALTALSRAEAEIRQREVMQQRASGGGGGRGRSNQDLSALFDRELLRQQQTNYEDRSSSSSSQQPDERDSDAQQRIRELAQRQDELARAQREFAAQRMSAEERRRQLERLTREQEELRQRAEQLARELQRQQGASAQQTRSLQQAAEDMRAASGELRRNDAESASERGGQAAERLRGAEQSGNRGDAASWAEVQIEAQQLADAQRRIETEQREAGNAADRLADRQQRLASRAEQLEQSARDVAERQGGSAARQRRAAGEAAEALSRERIAEGMRENADRLRRSAPDDQRVPDDPDPGADKLSSALERIAERLNAAGDAETRRAAAEIAKNQSARQRLEEMERRLERATREGGPTTREQVERELAQAEGMLRELGGESPQGGDGHTTPEAHEYSTSAPGQEAYKQDYARWEQLKRDIEHAIEARDLAIARGLAARDAEDGVAAGSVPNVPGAYREKVARYFEWLGRAGRRP